MRPHPPILSFESKMLRNHEWDTCVITLLDINVFCTFLLQEIIEIGS